jgi:hypothetical protein
LGTVDYLKDLAAKLIKHFMSLPASLEGGGAAIYGIPSWIIGLTLALLLAFVWMMEYALKLQRELTPRVTVKFDNTIPSCQSVSRFVDGTDAVCFRIEVENAGAKTVHYCEAYLTQVYRVGDPVHMGPMRLTWATSPTPFVSLPKHVKRHVDVFRVRQEAAVFVSSELGWPINQEHFFDRLGEYIFQKPYAFASGEINIL